MFSLAKLSYYSCNKFDRDWYDTVLKNGLKIKFKKCCYMLFKVIQGRKKLSSSNTVICSIAAKNGHLDCLMFAHEIGFAWNRNTCYLAASKGHLECLQFAYENECPWDSLTCTYAAKGHLNCLVYAHQNNCPWDVNASYMAAKIGALDCLEYIYINGGLWDEYTVYNCCEGGYLKCLKYAYYNGCPLGDSFLFLLAQHTLSRGQFTCLEFAFNNVNSLDSLTWQAFAIRPHGVKLLNGIKNKNLIYKKGYICCAYEHLFNNKFLYGTLFFNFFLYYCYFY